MVSVAREVATRADRAAAAFRASLAGRCLTRFHRLDGRDRTLALAGQGFTTLVPLLIVGAAFADEDAVARHLIARFRLSGPAAAAVTTLFSRPPGVSGTITLFGVLVLIYSSLSFTRSLQRTWEAAWELPPAGVRGTLHAVTGMALLMAQLIALALLADAFTGWPGAGVVGIGVRLAVATALWLQLQYLLLSRRVSRTELFPGAVVAGLGQVVAGVYSAVWMPRLIATDAARYGIIGVTFALLTWLIVIAFGIVLAAVVSAETGLFRGHDTEPTAEPGTTAEPVESAGTTAATAAETTAGTTAGTAVEPAIKPTAESTTEPITETTETVGTPVEPTAPTEPAAPARRRGEGLATLLHADRTDRFGAVLLLVVATVVWTVAAPPSPWARAIAVGLQTVTLFGALRAARVAPRLIELAAGLWVAGALVSVAAAAAGADAAGVGASLGVLLLSAALVAVLRRLVQQPDVSPRTAAGAVSACLRLGLLFTYLYATMAAFGAPPVRGTGPDAGLNDYLYFAFTTLTTTGYGDLSPASDVARAAAILEALLGQLYLVTVLALVIGNLRPRRRA